MKDSHAGCEFQSSLVKYNVVMLTYKATHNTPRRVTLNPLVCVADIPGRRALRSAVTDRLAVSSVRLHTVGNRAFPVAAAKIWNSLPDGILPSVSRLNTLLFRVSFSDLILKVFFIDL